MTEIIRSEAVSLRSLGLDETWLQGRLAAEPTLLGLGMDVQLIQRERRQARAGRLDLLLENGDGDIRFEVELMLGSLDESHIIRTIEYWDIERRRYPAYDHVAVIAAEDITSRFLSVLSLFSGTIPLVALQFNVLRLPVLPQGVVLHFSKVLDQRALRTDDTEAGVTQSTDRASWVRDSGEGALLLVDEVIAMINALASPVQYGPNFLQQYIGLKLGDRASNFVVFRPRRSKLLVGARVLDVDQVRRELEDLGIPTKVKSEDKIEATVSLNPSTEVRNGLKLLVHAAIKYQNS